jgi:hypothetical protein
MSAALSKDVPTYYIVLLLINGLFICFLSPLFLFLKTQTWINPFSQNTPSESLSSIALILLFAFIVGLPGLLVRDRVIGNNGPVSVLKRMCKGEKWIKVIEKQNASQNIEYVLWLKRTGMNRYLSFLNLQFAVVNGFLLGSGIAFIVNIPAIVILLLISKETFFFVQIFANSILCLSAFLYEKYFFRKDYNEIIKELNRRFAKSQHFSTTRG